MGQEAPWRDDAELTFECAPKTLTEKKVRALRDGGVTRLSLGIQQLNDDVLRRSGRIHLVADAQRAYQMVRHVGFDQVNVDLMVGMPGETETNFCR
ncbi:MAG: radical SAM protein [Acidobacteria bacterium]|nr:radical SAM protein [Acidobacteriota bacterium]MCZ6650324.1 radical SAM protein [Acidobacteriota bacterium]MCZ6746599.1 radical SAM protein [Acidobacteriota bacterium]